VHDLTAWATALKRFCPRGQAEPCAFAHPVPFTTFGCQSLDLPARADLPGATIAHLCFEHLRRTVPRQNGRDQRPVEGCASSAKYRDDERRGGPITDGGIHE
jgi:hypothetical protein